jgi:hypothetical protein
VAQLLGLVRDYPIVIHSQELTTPRFHMAAVGVAGMIDWRLPAVEAIAAIQRQGGVAIAAHPGEDSWTVPGSDAVLALDGAEAAHPSMLSDPQTDAGLRRFYENGRRLNARLAAIGSSDFHSMSPIGVCRTYLFVDDVSADAVLAAVRRGRTVAVCPGGRVTGTPQDVARLSDRLAREPASHFGYGVPTWIAIAALMGLGAVVLAR